MKSPLTSLTLALLLSTAFGVAQAAPADQPAPQSSCPLSQKAAPAMPSASAEEMARIEAALRAGRITPYEAGRLMRQQWEMAQFQRGFLEGAPGVTRTPGGCGGGSLDLSAMGDMARNGMQTASTLMRALIKETEKLVQDKAPL
jgi:hypothetical protein